MTGPEPRASTTSAARVQPYPTNAPPSQTCAVDTDCMVAVSAPGGPDPCCDTTVTALPISVAYVRFMESWRRAHCAGVTCSSMSLPGAQLAPCGYQARCKAGTCTNACGEPDTKPKEPMHP